MKALNHYRESTEYKALIGEVLKEYKEFASTQKEFVVNMKYLMAKTITESEAYKKWGKGKHGKGTFMVNLVQDLQQTLGKQISMTVVREAISLYEVQPDPQKVIEAGGWNRGLQKFLGRKVAKVNTKEACSGACLRHCSTIKRLQNG